MNEPRMYFTEDQFNQLAEMAGLIQVGAPSALDVVARFHEICRIDQHQRNALQRILRECGGGFCGEPEKIAPEKIAEEVIAHLRGGSGAERREQSAKDRLSRIKELQREEAVCRRRIDQIAGIRNLPTTGDVSGAHLSNEEQAILIRHYNQTISDLGKEMLKCL